jgi:flagellar basal-body rod protein FlgG
VIKGIYASYAALDAAWKYQEVLANNIANATTAGFKREVAAKESFADILLSQQAPVPAPLSARIQDVVGQIGTGSFMAEFATDYAPGAPQATGNELDLALTDGFFAVEAPGGEVFYTRDGRFGRDVTGDLVTSHGYYVLDTAGGHINAGSDPVAVAGDGTVSRAGQLLARLQVLDFTPGQLERAGEAYFRSTAAGVPVNGGVRQGYVEASNSVLVEELTSLLAVQRTFAANQSVFATQDATLNQAASQLGQFGA